ncbi:MAG: hypothetical protein Q9190_000216 [Brigantiaea leucoxantha]
MSTTESGRRPDLGLDTSGLPRPPHLSPRYSPYASSSEYPSPRFRNGAFDAFTNRSSNSSKESVYGTPHNTSLPTVLEHGNQRETSDRFKKRASWSAAPEYFDDGDFPLFDSSDPPSTQNLFKTPSAPSTSSATKSDAKSNTNPNSTTPPKTPRRRFSNPLLLSCRLVHTEALPIFYRENAFQFSIASNTPFTRHSPFPNLHLIRQCCFHVDIEIPGSTSRMERLLRKFILKVSRARVMEVLLVDIRQRVRKPTGEWVASFFRKLRGIHLAQVVIREVGPVLTAKSEGKERTAYLQMVERRMMSEEWEENVAEEGKRYCMEPRLGIELAGEELEEAKKRGGWLVGEADLHVLFGKL